MSDIGERMKKLRKQKELTVRELAKMAGLSRGHVSDIENGRRRPSVEAAEALAEALDTSPAWLLGVESTPKAIGMEQVRGLLPSIISALDEAYPTESANLPSLKELFKGLSEEQLLKILQQVASCGISTEDDVSTVIMYPRAEQKADFIIRIPLISAAGQPAAHAIGSVATNLPWGDYFAFKIIDDGMNLLAMPAGAVAIVERGREPQEGKIVAANIEGGPAVVRIYRELDELIMLEPRSTDSNFTAKIYPAQQVRVLGNVVRALVDTQV